MDKQNTISHGLFDKTNLADRIESIVSEVSKNSGFLPIKLIGKSAWWGSKEIGAFHYSGKYNGKNVVLKVQGVKPNTSEILMIDSFGKQNQSKIIRTPKIYWSQIWDEKKKYEAFILEQLKSKSIISVPTNQEEVTKFFKIFDEYRKNCLKKAWLQKPSEGIGTYISEQFNKWREASVKIYPHHELREDSDQLLIDRAINKLKKGYQKVDWGFQHGHLSDSDFYEDENSQIVVLSNLYWSWRAPYYDLIFAYHWFMYHLSTLDKLNEDKVEEQRQLWLKEIYKRALNIKLLELALLERATAGLNLDALSMDPKKAVSKYLIKKTRDFIKENL
jgi:hypothetical protein